MANPKYHWANAWEPGWGGHCVQAACGRKYVSTAFPDSAADFMNRVKCNPDWYCTDCAKAARLALAAESAPKPDTVIWPKPRPISEAPTDGCILGWVPATDELRAGWELLHYSVSATEWRDNAGIAHEPTHFLPLPPEAK